MSEFDPRWGVSIFQMILEFKNSELSDRERIKNFPQIFSNSTFDLQDLQEAQNK